MSTRPQIFDFKLEILTWFLQFPPFSQTTYIAISTLEISQNFILWKLKKKKESHFSIFFSSECTFQFQIVDTSSSRTTTRDTVPIPPAAVQQRTAAAQQCSKRSPGVLNAFATWQPEHSVWAQNPLVLISAGRLSALSLPLLSSPCRPLRPVPAPAICRRVLMTQRRQKY